MVCLIEFESRGLDCEIEFLNKPVASLSLSLSQSDRTVLGLASCRARRTTTIIPLVTRAYFIVLVPLYISQMI